jgi:hypothetical protein
MMRAHGGWEKWRGAKTISYTNIAFIPVIPLQEGMSEWDRWSWSNETLELERRRGYHDWPIEKGRIESDGKKVWTVDLPQGGNPPAMMFQNAFYFINLPWMTQDPGVRLGKPNRKKMPLEEDDKQYITIKMTFEGKTEEDYHLLYIDPETYLLKASEYMVTYAALLDAVGLPPDVKAMGPLVRIFDDYDTVDGFTIPSRYRTYMIESKTLFGLHVIANPKFSAPFDESRTLMPQNAVIDNSSATVRMSKK